MIGQNTNILQSKKFQIFFLVILAVISYIPSFQGVWQYDDLPEIVNNESMQVGVFNPEFFKGQRIFRSLTYMSFAFNHKVGGHDLFGYHLVNLLIHLFAGITIYFFIIELFRTLKLTYGREVSEKRIKRVAFMTTALWITTPVNVQAVTYIVQRLASMAGLFYFLSIFLYLKLRNSYFTNKKIEYRILIFMITAFLLALMSKQNSFLIIPSVLFIEWSFFNKASMRRIKVFFISLIIILPILLGVIYIFFNNGTDTDIWSVFQNNYVNREFSPLQRLFIEPRIVIHYISLMLFPFVGRFHLLYSFDWLNAPYQLFPYISILLIVLALVFSLKYVKKYKIFTFGILFFLINHLMESSIIGLQLAAEHRNYVPSVGIFLIIAYGFDILGKRFNISKHLYLFLSIFLIFSILNAFMLNLKYSEKYCNAFYDYKTQYNGLDHDVVAVLVDKLRDDKEFGAAFEVLSIEYKNIINNPHRKKFFDNYISESTRMLRYFVFLRYISSGFDVEKTLKFIESNFILDKDNFWSKVERKKNYDNIFSYFYIKSLLFKYDKIDNINYQKSLLFDAGVIDKYFYFRDKNYDDFVKYNLDDIKKLKEIELTENENDVLDKIK